MFFHAMQDEDHAMQDEDHAVRACAKCAVMLQVKGVRWVFTDEEILEASIFMAKDYQTLSALYTEMINKPAFRYRVDTGITLGIDSI